MSSAARLVNELMLVSVLVAGEGASALAAELEAQGASAQALAAGEAGQGFDLAILLAPPEAAGLATTRELVQRLDAGSERLLFAPLPLGGVGGGEAAALPELDQWFEVFAEFGYQPVVDFDASFVSPGAFLVDRAATAAESELAAFADRLQLGSDAPGRRDGADEAQAKPPAETMKAELHAVNEALAEARAALLAARAEAAVQAEAAAAEQAQAAQALQEMAARNAGWDNLRVWVQAAIALSGRDTVAALAAELPRLNSLRAKLPPVALPERRRGFWRRPAPTPPILADMAAVRASRLFDAAWYIASNPELTQGEPLDPVFHYVLVGWHRGADPGPWFSTAAYLAAHPELAGSDLCPLVHAIRTGEDRAMDSA